MDSLISFLLIVFIIILLIAIVSAHLVDGVLRGVSTRRLGLDRKAVPQDLEQPAQLYLGPIDYRDVQIDDLLEQDRIGEAQKIVTERLRHAIELNDDERIRFYRQYQSLIDGRVVFSSRPA